MSGRILVVDDIIANVKLLEIKLKKEYYDVITAYSGAEALEKIESDAPDLVLLDVMMPQMNGFEVCQRIRSNPKTQHLPIVMVTALSEVEDRITGLQVGADDFLTKPVNDTALFARVRSLIRLKMVMDEWQNRINTAGELGIDYKSFIEDKMLLKEARILVVEDSEEDWQLIKETLQKNQHILIHADNGEDALDYLSRSHFDLIITNISMIDEDGLRLVSQFRSQESLRHLPILLMADEDELDRAVKGLEMGASDYLLKPIETHEFLARVSTQIKRKRFQDALKENLEQNLSMAITDALTGAFNRRYADTHLSKLLKRMADEKKQLCAVMLDIDFFKKVNDVYGHLAGDEVLQKMTKRIQNCLREVDLFIRLGGEEFLIILPEARLDFCRKIIDRVLHIVSDEPFNISVEPYKIPISISAGVVFSTKEDTQETLLHRADAYLYKAKKEGRNRAIFQNEEKNEEVLLGNTAISHAS